MFGTKLRTQPRYLPFAAGSETLVHDLQRSQQQTFVASNSSRAQVQSQSKLNHIICKSDIRSFIHSFRSLPYDKPIASSKTRSLHSAL